jgi:MinD-like ATPase involved in chromosome partitioning or flagellar assembly
MAWGGTKETANMSNDTAPIEDIHSPLDDLEATWMPSSEHAGAAAEGLANRYPEHAAAIRKNRRLDAALDAALQATNLTVDEIVEMVGGRELMTAQRPIDVLVSRTLVVIREHAVVTDDEQAAAENTENPSGDDDAQPTTAAAPAESSGRDERGAPAEPDLEVASAPATAPAEPKPAAAPQSAAAPANEATPAQPMVKPAAAAPRNGKWLRASRPAAANTQLIAQPLHGNRYVAVVGAHGGAGATTAAVILGHVLATHRSDQIVATDATTRAGALAFRAGSTAPGTIHGLVAAEEHIHGCAELARYVDRLPSRLGVAKSVHGEKNMTADQYRKAMALLARYYDVILTDVGADLTCSTSAPALGLADLVVVAASPTTYGLHTATTTLDALRQSGVDASLTMVLVNGVHRRSPLRPEQFSAVLGSECASVVWLPWDQQLVDGGPVSPASLHRLTGEAATHIGATSVHLMAAGLATTSRS